LQSAVKVPNNILEMFSTFSMKNFGKNSRLDQLLHRIWIIIAEVRVDAT